MKNNQQTATIFQQHPWSLQAYNSQMSFSRRKPVHFDYKSFTLPDKMT
jgi:hypothetical protein